MVPPRPPEMPAPATTPVVADAPEPAQVTLRVDGPLGALVTVDGKAAGAVPLVLRLPRAEGVRRVSVHHGGYRSFTREVSATVDVVMFAHLRRVAPARARQHLGAEEAGVRDPFAR